MILGYRAVHGFAGSDAVWVVGIGNRIITMREGGKPPAVLPGEGETVPVGEGIADFIIGDGLAVKAGQKIITIEKWRTLLYVVILIIRVNIIMDNMIYNF